MIGRIPITDISPVVIFGRDILHAKAIVGEEILIGASIFREGHDALGAIAVLLDSNVCYLSKEPKSTDNPECERGRSMIKVFGKRSDQLRFSK